MITLSGFRPDEDIEIKFTGVRPGEKLFEELRTEGEDIEPTVHPKIRVWKCRPADWDRVQKAMEEFASLQNCFRAGKGGPGAAEPHSRIRSAQSAGGSGRTEQPVQHECRSWSCGVAAIAF